MSPKRLRILCVIDSIAMGGGAEQLVATLLPEMRRQGADVELAMLFDQSVELDAVLQRAGVTLHRLNLSSRLSLLEAIGKLRALVRRRHYDVFWGHLFYGNLYGWLFSRVAGRGSVALTLHSEGYLQSPPSRVRDRVFRAIEGHVLRAADVRVAVSNAVRRDYEAFFGLGDIKVIYNGVDIQKLEAAQLLDPASVRKKFGYVESDFLTVTAASFIPKKGHGVWLDAIQLLRDRNGIRIKAFLCGNGPYERVVEDVARRGLADQVTVSPALAHEELLPLIASAQAVVLPSLREPFGIAAAEGMALGKACVLTDVDGFRELTEGPDCALTVPAGDSTALADAIVALHADRNLCVGLGTRARAHIRASFDIANCAGQWIKVLCGAARVEASS